MPNGGLLPADRRSHVRKRNLGIGGWNAGQTLQPGAGGRGLPHEVTEHTADGPRGSPQVLERLIAPALATPGAAEASPVRSEGRGQPRPRPYLYPTSRGTAGAWMGGEALHPRSTIRDLRSTIPDPRALRLEARGHGLCGRRRAATACGWQPQPARSRLMAPARRETPKRANLPCSSSWAAPSPSRQSAWLPAWPPCRC